MYNAKTNGGHSLKRPLDNKKRHLLYGQCGGAIFCGYTFSAPPCCGYKDSDCQFTQSAVKYCFIITSKKLPVVLFGF